MDRKAGVAQVLEQRAERLTPTPGHRERVDIPERRTPRRGERLQVGAQPVGTWSGRRAWRSVEPSPRGLNDSRVAARALRSSASSRSVVGSVGDLGGEMLQHSTAQPAQLAWPELLGLLDQVGLRLDAEGVAEVLRNASNASTITRACARFTAPIAKASPTGCHRASMRQPASTSWFTVPRRAASRRRARPQLTGIRSPRPRRRQPPSRASLGLGPGDDSRQPVSAPCFSTVVRNTGIGRGSVQPRLDRRDGAASGWTWPYSSTDHRHSTTPRTLVHKDF